ncbi:PAAR domain-containing protein [Candidatus Thiosymbion oneisti]|uniref:PAAR domain-containing protein n=1 Tax=Candidatus Thiosymbion oneisti TaxID=589554 RepID=UPI000B305567|nr:PAAR domain-containing protein [Candidatus Thiosymbion oneisti]
MSKPTTRNDDQTASAGSPENTSAAGGLTRPTNGRPAARVGDVTAQGDVITTGDPTFLIDGRPAARVGDVTARGDVIATGNPTFLIGGKPAAGVGDVTARGDFIVTGSPTLFIGSSSRGQTTGRPSPLDPAFAKGLAPEQRNPSPAESDTILDPSVQEARKHIDSTAWAYEADRPPYPSDTYKCNLFVYETLDNSGKPVPMMERERLPGIFSNILKEEHPPLAGQWADPSVEIPGWQVVTDPQPGDVAAIAQNSSNASGHVGIVSGPSSTISATREKVVESDWGFEPGQKPTFRRYVGP